MKKLFTKTGKNNLKKFAKSYYNAYNMKLVANPDFEYCMSKEGKEEGIMRCNTCDYKKGCAKGERIFEDNPNIIEELTEQIIEAIEKKFNKLYGREKSE